MGDRVCRDGRLVGVLEVSRSIGDGAFKMHGVSSTPDVKKCQLTSDDRSVIIIQYNGVYFLLCLFY